MATYSDPDAAHGDMLATLLDQQAQALEQQAAKARLIARDLRQRARDAEARIERSRMTDEATGGRPIPKGKPGMIVAVRSCARCLRILAPTSGDDCPDHTLPCCGGKGAQHATGCEQDPMFIAGREWAMRREAAVMLEMGFLGPD